MCCRYYYSKETTLKVFREVGIKTGLNLNFSDCEVTPGSESYIISGFRGEITAQNAVWGFPSKGGGLVINARSESVLSKPMFCSSVMNRRCILPAERFYEWDYDRNKVGFSVPDRDVIYLAGFWNLFEDVIRYVVLTTAANESMISVHDRMPLIIEKNDIEPWILDNNAYSSLLTKRMPLLKQLRDYEQLCLF